MSKKPPFTPKPNRIFQRHPKVQHPPIDRKVRLPYEVRRAAALADALSTGQPVKEVPRPKKGRGETKIKLADSQIDEAIKELDRGDIKVSGPLPRIIIELARAGAQTIKERRDGARKPRGGRLKKQAPQPKKSRGEPKIRLSDSEIKEALKCLDRGNQKFSDPLFSTIIQLAREGAKIIKARRDGARQPRAKSDIVTRRMEAALQAYRELSPKRQAFHNGAMTLRDLLRLLQKEGFNVHQDLLRRNLQQLGPILGLIRNGLVPKPGPKPVNRKLSKETQQEMIAGKRALARHRSGR